MDEELVQLPWTYRAPAGRLLLARYEGIVVGCVALRPLPGQGADVCELRRLYVRPWARSARIGRALVAHAITQAQHIGYRRMLLNSVPAMIHAQLIYRALGFSAIAPYALAPPGGEPHAGVQYFERAI